MAFILSIKFGIYIRPDGLLFLIYKTHIPKRYDLVLFRDPYTNKIYVSRVIGLPGDTILIKGGIAYINGVKEKNISEREFLYSLICSDQSLQNFIQKQGIAPNIYHLSQSYLSQLDFSKIRLYKVVIPKDFYDKKIYPYSFRFKWNGYFFGPFVCPFKGLKVYNNDAEAFSKYRILLKNYENLAFEKVNYFIFKNNYYFLLNDMRYNVNDSRQFGPLPYNYIIGKIILSIKM